MNEIAPCRQTYIERLGEIWDFAQGTGTERELLEVTLSLLAGLIQAQGDERDEVALYSLDEIAVASGLKDTSGDRPN